MQQNATRPSKLRECSSANCGDVHPPAFDSDEPKTRLRNEPNLTLYFQQELRTKAKFHPERQADSPAHGCIRVQPDATRSQIVRMLHPLRGGRTPAVEPKIKLRNEANLSFLFNKGSKWKPNSVSARLRRPPPDATQMQPHATLSAKWLQPSRRDAVYPNHSPKWLLPKFPGSSDSTCPKRRGHYETKGSTRNWLRSPEKRRAATAQPPRP